MLDIKTLADGCLSYTIICDSCGRSYRTSYTIVPPLAAANMVIIEGHTLCARCAKELYGIDVKY